MTKSQDTKEIAAALARAQGNIQNVPKDATNPHFDSDYASLAAITAVVRPAFAKEGLAVVQMPAFRDGLVVVETLITHTSGQWILGESASPIAKADPQGIGSATTYLRRYSLAAVAALAQTDDDGNTASQPAVKPPARTTKAAVPTKPAAVLPLPDTRRITDAQRKVLRDVAKEHGWRDEEVRGLIKETCGVESSTEIPFFQYSKLLDMLKSGTDAVRKEAVHGQARQDV